MPRAAVGTPKHLANAMKAKGLQKLRWYCQVCEKQCRDENGFKCHAASEGHLRQMLVVGEQAGKHISDYSKDFQNDFVTLLSRRFSTQRVRANQVYQEYIQDRQHVHMNSTRWVTLSEFVKYLGREGIVRVDETEKGFYIAWIDSSPKALAKADAAQKKERATVSDEQRERTLIAEQIARAAAETSPSTSTSAEEPVVGLQRQEGDAPVKLSFGLKKSTSLPATDAATAPTTSAPFVAKPNPLKIAAKPVANPLKGGNVFKSSKASGSGAGKREREQDVSAAQRLILEEQERKRRRMEREASSSGVRV